MTRTQALPFRLVALALAAGLAGCTTIGNWFSSPSVDYQTSSARSKPLDVPPDLSQLARDSRYQVQGGVVSAAAAAGGPAAAAAAAPGAPSVALAQAGSFRVERDGQQRWLVSTLPPEQLWPQVRAFWEQRGFTIEVADERAGVMETAWAEDRSKLPQDIIRQTIGRVLSGLYDTGLRDRFRTRLERTAQGTEIYVSHQGLQEVYVGERREQTTWRGRPSDPQLEADFLARMMVALGSAPAAGSTRTAAAAPAVAAAASAAVAAAPAGPARARRIASLGTPALEVDEGFDRAWRRVALALDRGGFTVEDRDRSAGLFFVRYVDPKSAGKEEPGWWSRLFGSRDNPLAAVRYRVVLKAAGDKTTVSVLSSAGAPETSENAERIAALLVNELR